MPADVLFPLSLAQRSRWFMYRLAPSGQGRHNNVFAVRMDGAVDVAALSSALDAMAERHPMLRARIVERDGIPMQYVDAIAQVPLAQVEAADRDAEALQRQVTADALRAFDLAQAPPIRACLYRLGPASSVFLLAMDHMVSDGWSYWRLLGELGSRLSGGAAPSPVPATYRDHVAAQQAWLDSDAGMRQLAYWKDALAGELPMLGLSFARRERATAAAHAFIGIDLEASLVARLRAFSTRHASTPFAVLLAAYQIALHRFTGQDDIVVGCPMPARGDGEWDAVVGDFVNVVPMRTRFDRDADLASVLRDVRRTVLRGMAHQDYPFPALVERLRLSRTDGHPVFQTLFAFQKARDDDGLHWLWHRDRAAAPRLRWGELALSPFDLHQHVGVEGLDLSLQAIEVGDTVRCDFGFDAGRFDASAIARFAHAFHRLVDAMTQASGDIAVDALPLLDDGERQQVVETFNDTAVPWTPGLLHARFETQAAATPDAVALEHAGQRLTYATLNAQANRLAHRLQAMGVGPETRVAICVPRTIEMVIGLLGVLKAGGAYVPLDPAYPRERLSYVLEDSAPLLLLSVSGLRDALPQTALPVVWLDEADTFAAQPSHDPAPSALAPGHLAYVIYTSGSTGRPKGVMITHANADNFIDWSLRAFDPALLSSTVFSTSICFDLSIFELFAPLSSGGRVLLVEDLLSSGSVLPEATLVNTVPSAIAAMLDGGPLSSSVRQVNVAGEPLKRTLVERLFERTGIAAVANLYGPSETTTYSTWVKMTRGTGFVPHIGRPIANTRVYIVDRHDRPVPIGVAGELLIGGAGVARGYLGRPELTAERFVEDPFVPGGRVYRTGDLGRWRADGTIEYLGRNDFQVKLRGFRIELGEIEAQLSACAGVREAVVVAREDVPGHRRLVAYVAAHDGVELSIPALRERLSTQLAEYMVPSAFVLLPALPLTPNGKLDRAALPAPDHAAMTTRAYAPPEGEAEQTLARIWSELLGVEQVGREDHFFELGGHSLVAVQVVARLRAALGVEVPLREVFSRPVLRELAATLSATAASGALSPIAPADRTAALPLSWAQQRLWFLDRLDPAASVAYHMPAALRLSGRLDRDALGRALDRIVARHEVLRTRFGLVEGVPVQEIGPETTGFALIDRDLSREPAATQAERVAQLAAEESVRPFDLAHDAPIRGQLLRLSPEDHVLLVTQHHIASDGWSVGVLIREVGALYAAFVAGEADPLPPLAIQYADYAVWQRGEARDAAMQRQLAHWQEHLSGAPALLELPTDRPRPAVQSHAGADLAVSLPASLTARVKAFARRHEATPFMVLLAAWSVLLSRLSGQDDVVIGTPVANRERPETEPLIGFFVNTLALRVRMTPSTTVEALLSQVRADTLSAYAHQEVPFERVVEALQPVRSLAHAPVFQAMLALDNTPLAREIALSGLHLSPVEQATTKAHFDLSLSLRETAGQLSGQLNYATDLFDRSTLQRWWGSYERLLDAMVDAPWSPVCSLPLLGEDERRQVVETFNDTAVPWKPGLLHARFETHAAATPDAVALEHAGQRLTYAALNAQANRLAHRLQAMGVGPETRVAICVPRSVEMVIGLLGVLKAGGAYVPLDPAYPRERLSYVLEDSTPLLLLSVSGLRDALPQTALPVVWLDEADTFALQPSHDPAPSGLDVGHLAYVIYTSGSTGRPKGVMITHANVSNMIDMHVRFCGLSASDRALQFSTFAFDASVEEIFGPLSAGATLVLHPPEAMASADRRFSDYLRSERITATGLPTVFWNHWARSPDFAGSLQDTALRWVFIGGEKQDRQSLDAWLAGLRGRDVRLIDAYGPTEATVYVSANDYRPDFRGPQSLGRPLANSRIYIVDRHDQPVPIGVAGELLIGGVQVGRGYLGRPELTAERFVEDPFVPGGRVYRTGDLGRWRPDGTIEYLGRNDFQVKLRGFRIELGEIEAQLSACAGVREGVVTVREDVPGHRRLVAYVAAQDGVELSIPALRERLSTQLAEYMVPSAFVLLPALPLTPNGKLDRAALPAPDHAAMTTRVYAPPEGETEQTLARIWSELLGVEQVGREDHFFELGGHSLVAVQVVARLRAALGVEVPLREVFSRPVLRELAATLSATAASGALSPIAPADRTAALPLSWAQQRLWFLDRLDPAASVAYHMPAALRLSGRLDREALGRALDRIVARHAVLRTRFGLVEGVPVQEIGPETTGFALVDRDLSREPAATQAERVARLAAEESVRPFDLARDAPIRGQLLRLSAEDHVLLVTQHHIASDGWSVGVLIREVGALYAAFVAGEADPLPPLAIQYADYAVWQRGEARDVAMQRQLAHWQEHLSGAPALLELPTDRPRPAVQSHAGADLAVSLPASLTARVKAFARRHEATPFMVLLAAWSVLLSRLSGQDEVVVGTPVANRERPETEPLIGFFVNTLALRVRMTPSTTVEALLSQVRADTLSAYAHQEVPFERVVEALQPVRSLAHAPVFQAMLALDNTPLAREIALSGLHLSPVEQATTKAHFDLSLSLRETAGQLSGQLNYATDLFDRSTLQRWWGSYERLLDAMVDAPWSPVCSLPLLGEDERRQVVETFNDTAVPYPDDALIHDVFAGWVARTPEAVAVRTADADLTYAGLDRRANRLAHRLQAAGVGPETRVAVCMARGEALIVALLGVLKAGGAYVPLDTAYPPERLSRLLADCDARVVLTDASTRGGLPEIALPVWSLDQDACAEQPETPLAVPGPGSRNLAYVIYTSGSTGMPKGVMVEHRSVLRLVLQDRYAPVRPGDVVGHGANPAFDAATWEIWAPLLNGGCTCVLDREDMLDASRLGARLKAGRVKALWLTVGLFNQLVDHIGDGFSGLDDLLIGGDALDPASVSRLLASPHRPRRLTNGYGPTETTTFATTHRIEAVPPGARSIPIGRPIANTTVYLLDAQRTPVPIGVTGELYVGGPGVARGYLGRPELTAERFVEDPFVPGGRVYRTGDLGRWRPDGTIEYLGRNDFQVKLRGFRIELGEIEAQLSACAGVREAVVVAREDIPGDKRLVAYVVPDPETPPSAATLREQLSTQLAEYMVPSAFVLLPALPLTPNGKLDRAALPAPDHAAMTTRAYAPPEGEAEQTVARIWSELLGVEQVGREDHFFELGGHSLVAVQVVARLRAALGVEVPLREVFSRPVLRELASTLSATAASGALSPIEPADRSAALPLSWAQQRLWFLDRLDPAASVAYHMPAALRLSGRLDRAALGRALDRIVARHEVLRTRFGLVEGVPVQEIGPETTGFALAEEDLCALSAEARETVVRQRGTEEATVPFDLASGPLIRGRLLRLSTEEHILLVTQHHIVSDGWSIGVLVRELMALYAAFAAGDEDPLPPLAIQYADYAAWQRRHLAATLEAEGAYWRTQLAGAPALLELPTDRPRPAVQTYAGSSVPVRVPARVTAGLRALSQRHGATLFMTLLSAWSVLLSRLSGQDEVVVGTPVANREREEIESLVGFFVNTLALRVRPGEAGDVGALLSQVKATSLEAYAHQALPFDQVVEAVKPVRSLSHNAIFQSMLSLDTTRRTRLTLAGLTLEELEPVQVSADFDLSLSLVEEGDELSGRLEYATDLFDKATVERWQGYLHRLLEALSTAASTEPVWSLPLLDDGERQQVVETFNDTAVPWTPELLHARFEAQAAATPDAVALEHAGQRLTYATLNAQANRLANRLQAMGVGPETRVAICVPRTIEMVIGLLGVLKAGGAYVPLDPAYPRERLSYVLEDSTPLLLLSVSGLRDALPQTALPVVWLDEADTFAAQPSHDPAPSALAPAHLAYVIYTSGSTGRPKGVMITHANADNFIDWSLRAFDPALLSSTVFSTSICFDLSIFELFAPLSSGGRVLLVEDLLSSGSVLPEATLVNTVPSAIAAVLDGGPLSSSVRQVNVAGEPLKRALVERLFERTGIAAVANLYGPSETTTYSTWVKMTRGTGFVPHIGRPIANTRVYIVDRHDRPVPIGVAGELLIGGAGVARGYLGRPELTAERFVEDPFVPGGRVYRTGDLGRWRPDGTIEYLGRNDFQVKLRGFRIELGEIEAQLSACAGVHEAVVTVREDVPGHRRLVAYVVPQEGVELSVSTLREQVSTRLTEYMVPSAFVLLPALPLTPNGKLDRAALPAPDHAAMTTRAYAPPEGEAEQTLARIWSELLGVEQVGREDHFFELGGSSLLLVRLGFQLHEAFGVELKIGQVYEAATLKDMAALLDAARERAKKKSETRTVTLDL